MPCHIVLHVLRAPALSPRVSKGQCFKPTRAKNGTRRPVLGVAGACHSCMPLKQCPKRNDPQVPMFPVFDGHNDFLTALMNSPDRAARWPGASQSGHLDLPRMRASGFVGGFFAIWVPGDHETGTAGVDDASGPYDMPLPPPVPLAQAQACALNEAGQLRWMERQSGGALRVCLTGAEVRATIADGGIAAIMHMEGAEPIDPGLDALHVWHAAGLRSLGPVWSRPTAFGHGVPFRYPGTPDTGDGLTDAGKRLVRECDELGIMLDMSHLNEKGFDDVAAITTRPIVATHSNVHAISPVPRNLTDRQLAVIRDSNGVVGLNFATAFLNENGAADPATPLSLMVRHLDHLIAHLGEDGVALGSDFDGARIPDAIGDVTGVQALCQAMLDHGYGEDLVRKISCDNWLGLLDRVLV